MGRIEMVPLMLLYGIWALLAYPILWIHVRNVAKETDGVVTWGNMLALLFLPLLPVINMLVVVMTVMGAFDSIKDKPCFRLKRRLTDAEVEALIEEIESLKRR